MIIHFLSHAAVSSIEVKGQSSGSFIIWDIGYFYLRKGQSSGSKKDRG